MQFNDSIENNCEVIEELLRGVMPQHRNKAKRAAVAIENQFTALQRDYPKDPAVALGAAYAIFKLAQRLVEAGKDSDGGSGNLIQLLS